MNRIRDQFLKVMGAFSGRAGMTAETPAKPVRRGGDEIDTGLGRVPRLANDGGHDLVFRHIVQRRDGGFNAVYTHPTKPAFTRSGHPIRTRAMVVPLEKARVDA